MSVFLCTHNDLYKREFGETAGHKSQPSQFYSLALYYNNKLLPK